MPKLSVVVPFHNVERYIEECLGSLRAQTFEDFEVVLVDDGSTDASRATADRFAAADRRFRVVSQEQSGAGPARNLGLRHAEGEYLAFADSDDLVAPRAYSLLVDTLRATRSEIAAGNAARFGARGVRPSWTHAEPFARTRLRTSLASSPSLIRDRMVWNKVFRRSFWDENQFEYAAISYQDYPVALAANLRAGAVDVVHPRVYYWRDRPTGDSTTQQVTRMRAVIDVAELQATDMADSPVSRAQSRAIGFRPLPTALGAAAETAVVPATGPDDPEPVRQRWAGQRPPYLAVPLTQTTLGDEIFSIAAYPSGHARVDRIPAPAAESGDGLSR